MAANLYEFETSALYGGGWIRKKRKAKILGEEAGREKKLQHILVDTYGYSLPTERILRVLLHGFIRYRQRHKNITHNNHIIFHEKQK